MSESSFQPVPGTNRILSLDVLRGVAVLGILIMNIQSFSMPSAAYINPMAYGDMTGLNKWIWIFSHLLASEKFMTLFSLLFGAGVLLFTEHAESKGKNSAALHYRRMGWLMLFGLIHAYLFWYGDILFKYSLCGMLIYLFRKMSSRPLVWMGFGFFIVPLILNALFAWSIPYWPEENVQSTLHSWKPDPQALAHIVESMRGTWTERMGIRVPEALFMHTGYFLMGSFWRIMSMMLLGMALFKWKVLSAQRSSAFYLRMLILGLVSGYALSALGVILNFRAGWTMEFSMFTGHQFNYVGSLGVALGYAGGIMLICKTEGYHRFKQLFSSVGRMAFTNYVYMTLMAVFLFNGAGLALFGRVERDMQALILLGIWIFLVAFSFFWLKYFRYGPLEALWRSLTYGKRQKILNSLVFFLSGALVLFISACGRPSAQPANDDDNTFSFAFLTDIHVQPELGADVGFRRAIREVNSRLPDFVLTGGDLVMDALNQSYGRADSLYTLYIKLSEKFKMPVYNTMGNHEVFGWQRMEPGIEAHPEFGKRMFENRLGKRYYSFDHKGWHFIVLDAIYLGERGFYAGKIDEKQINWLAEDLSSLEKETPIALSTHYPFITAASQVVRGSNVANPESMVVINSREVLALFSDYNLRLVLQGHLHYLEDIHVQNQVHFITGGAVSGKWWNNHAESKPEEGFVMIHVNGEDLEWEYIDFGWTPPG